MPRVPDREGEGQALGVSFTASLSPHSSPRLPHDFLSSSPSPSLTSVSWIPDSQSSGL